MNFNALLHPEVLTSKPGYSTEQKGVDELDSQVAPEELNLSEGLVGSLVDKIYVHKAKEAENGGSNAVEWMRKRKATAEENLRSHDKRITAGLLAATGKYHLSTDIRDFVQKRVNAKELSEYNRRLKKKDEYDTLCAKVEGIKALNLPPERLNLTQLKIMLRWYKQDGDQSLPTKKQDQLTRYYETCNRGDLPPPLLPQPFSLVQNDMMPLPDDLVPLPLPPNDINAPPVAPLEGSSSHNEEERALARILAGFNYEDAVAAATSV